MRRANPGAPRHGVPRVVATSDVTRFRGVAVAALTAAVVAAAAAIALSPASSRGGAPGPLSPSHRRAGLACATCHGSGARGVPPATACTACHQTHPSTRPGHTTLRASGALACAGCHGGHRGHGAVTFFPDGRAVRDDDVGSRDVAVAGYRPTRALTVPLVDAATCAGCHDPTRAPLLTCVIGGVVTCLDEHRAVRGRDGTIGGRDGVWEAARAVAHALPPRPRRPDRGSSPWLGLAIASVAALVTGGSARAIARRRRGRRDAAAVAHPAAPLVTAAAIRRLPVIDAATCLGCDACVEACPYDVLEVRRYVAVVARPDACCGLTLCAQVCPNQSLTMRDAGGGAGAAPAPTERGSLEAAPAPGVFVVGDARGGSLIRNAVDEGARAVVAIAARLAAAPRPPGDPLELLDVLIVGAGPAGLAAALEAQARGLRALTLEQGTVAGSVQSFPRGKLVLDAAAPGAAAPRLWLAEATKEELLARWMLIVRTERPPLVEGRRVTALAPIAVGGGWRVESSDGSGATTEHRARHVVIAVGRRGSPRRLGFEIPSAMTAHVHYALADAASFAGRQVVIVGLGDVAMESAIALSRQPGTEVVMVYRGTEFRRGRTRNIDELRRRIAAGAVRIAWRSEVVGLAPGRATVATAGGRQDVGCDALFVLIGAEPGAEPATGAGTSLLSRLIRPVPASETDPQHHTFESVDPSVRPGDPSTPRTTDRGEEAPP